MTSPRHLTDIASLSDDVFARLLSRSLDYRDLMDRGAAIPPRLAGRLQFNLFFENSTRTNLSFEVAAKRLGMIVSMVPVAASSVHKGESLEDTVLTLGAQGADTMVLRATEPGTIDRAISALAGDGFPTSVINAGEGALGHPTQGLLDAATALRAAGRTPDETLEDLTLTICGDVRHSRVAASSIESFARLGATVRITGPEPFLPDALPDGVAAMDSDIAAALDGADFVMPLRIQRERLAEGLSVHDKEFFSAYGLTYERLALARPGAMVMHPGPMNRGIEIDGALADDPERSLIRTQVRQGVATRMALLEWIGDSWL